MKELFTYKKSKITLIVSWILAGIMLIVGIILAVGDSPAYDGSVSTIYLNRTKNYSGQEVMYKFTPNSSDRYEIQTSVSGSYNVYVLTKNSQNQIDEGDYVYYGSKSGSAYFYVSLSYDETYYVYVACDYYSSISVTITD